MSIHISMSIRYSKYQRIARIEVKLEYGLRSKEVLILIYV